MHHIALVEDDEPTSNRLRKLLETIAGVPIEVTQFFDRPTAEAAIARDHFDLLVVDVDLGPAPKEQHGGLSILSRFGAERTTIIVTGMPEENLHAVALTLNAYEFISKPVDDLDFQNKVVHALEWQAPEIGSAQKGGVQGLPPGLTPDPKRKPQLLWNGRPVELTLTELTIVHALADNPNQVVAHNKLAAAMKSSVSPKALAVHLAGIRRKFREVDGQFDHIETAPAKGYCWKTGA